MKRSFVLMTAMPPTKGHLQLIQFARKLADETKVILCTQPIEPLANERYEAVNRAIQNRGWDNVRVVHYHRNIEQDPKVEGFWPMWVKLMRKFGLHEGDLIVASEKYGQKLAKLTGAEFFPYDIDREINNAKATDIRNNPWRNFDGILPEFQKYLRVTITIFGAESTGKTTLSKQLAKQLNAYWLFEYARPYLENTVNEITPRSMNAIWKGQAALQRQAKELMGKPVVIQDTDLFSTVGYWEFPHWQDQLGKCPQGLIDEARELKSDLYIITRSNIPFEQDPLRYGGDQREGSDEYWIKVCRKYRLPYVILDTPDRDKRIRLSVDAVQKLLDKKQKTIYYDRKGL